MPDLAFVKPCILEITPMCDYVQEKCKASRFLIGLIVSDGQVKKKKNADFLYQTPFLSLDNNLCSLVINFYYLISIKNVELSSLKPKYQLRIGILSDVQHKFSSHISRPGVMELR
jgi:hypothetical protein